MPFGDGLRAIIQQHHPSELTKMQIAIDVLYEQIKNAQGVLATAVIAAKSYEQAAHDQRKKEGEAKQKIADLEAALIKLGASPTPPRTSKINDDDDWRDL